MGFSRRGFSLVEVVVVLGILLVLAAIILPTLGPMRRQGRMRVGAAAVAETLRLARSLAITHSAVYCVDFEFSIVPAEMHIISGDPPSVDHVEKLPEGVEFFDTGTLPAVGALNFRPDGSCAGTFTINIRNHDSAADTRRIEVKAASGQIVVTGGAR